MSLLRCRDRNLSWRRVTQLGCAAADCVRTSEGPRMRNACAATRSERTLSEERAAEVQELEGRWRHTGRTNASASGLICCDTTGRTQMKSESLHMRRSCFVQRGLESFSWRRLGEHFGKDCQISVDCSSAHDFSFSARTAWSTATALAYSAASAGIFSF